MEKTLTMDEIMAETALVSERRITIGAYGEGNIVQEYFPLERT